MRALDVGAMRLHQIESQLRAARDLSSVVARMLPDTSGLPEFGHLDRWLGLLAREHQLALV